MINTQYYLLLAGDPGEWDAELKCRVDDGESLVAVQRDQYKRGRRSAEMMKNSRGWAIRDATGLGPISILFQPGQNESRKHDYLAECLEWGRKWANEDPDNRELFMEK